MASAAEQLASSINFGALAKATELKQRIWYTLGILIVARIGAYIPLPGIDGVAFQAIFQQHSGGVLGMAKSLSEANVVFVFAERSSDVERFLDFAELRKWFGARDDQKFDDIEATFREAQGFCFRIINAPDSEITRAIGFISNVESAAVQEKCLARNLLFAVGLRGQTDSPASAKSADTSSRSIGLLDEMALNVLYREGVEPGMTLRQALSK